MKKMRMIRVFMLMAVCSLGFLSCDKDDDPVTDAIENEDPTKNPQGTTPTDSIEVEFKLLNAEGKSVTTFSYGENITFYLSLTNISSQDIETSYLNPWEAWGEDLFHVFTKDGQDMGKPWDLYLVRLVAPTKPFVYEPGYAFSCSCKWKGVLMTGDESEKVLRDTYTGTPIVLEDTMPVNEFYQQKEREFLPKGEYYTKYEITLSENKTSTGTLSFTIE